MPAITVGDTAAYLPLLLYTGRQNIIDIAVRNPDGTNYSFAGTTAKMDLRRFSGAPAILQLTTANGRIVLSAGNIRLIVNTATMDAIAGQNAWHDFVTVVSSEETQFIRGPIILLPTITQ